MAIVKFTGDVINFGEDVRVVLEFTINGFLVTPDDASVSYTLKSQTATLLTDVVVDAGETSITIDKAMNLQESSEEIGVRFLTLNFLEDGKAQTFQINYYLTKFVPLMIDAKSVRHVLGVDPSELPDESITLYQTYRALKQDLGLDPFAEPLLIMEANTLVLYCEALKQARALNLKVLQRSKIDDHLKERAIIKFNDLIPKLEAEFTRVYRLFGTIPDVPQFEVISSAADAITGV